MLNAVFAAPAKPFPMAPLVKPIFSVPPTPGCFLSAPVVGAPLVATGHPGKDYVQIDVAPSSFLWDAVTTGYAYLSDLRGLYAPPAAQAARRLRKFAAARASIIRALCILPRLPNSPRLHDINLSVDPSEKGVASFLLGEAMSLRQAKVLWAGLGVKRLFHRSIYHHRFAGIPPGPSPDYLCVVGNGFGSVESKGLSDRFAPESNSTHREKLDSAFRQLTRTLPAIPTVAAVSVACIDNSIDHNAIVGQFWDPPIENSTAIDGAVVHSLQEEYFLRLFEFLNAFGLPTQGGMDFGQNANIMVWNCNEIGFRVGMSVEHYRMLSRLHDRAVTPRSFTEWIAGQDFNEELAAHNNPNVAFNSDGLYLEDMEGGFEE